MGTDQNFSTSIMPSEQVSYAPERIECARSGIQFNFNILGKKNGCRAIVNNDNDNPEIGSLEVLHKTTEEVKMVGTEIDGLYHALITISDGDAFVTSGAGKELLME